MSHEERSIKAIEKSSVHRITSGQVVVDLQTAVKELVENSLDAGASNVEVRFKQYGLSLIEVVDDGSGIKDEDFENIALKHHTSKLSSYEDLSIVHTFGFRGEALSSLCAVSEQVAVCTATAETAPKGTTLEMDSHGRVKKRSTTARKRGTTMSITSLFSALPVRRKELQRNIKREFGKALSLLHAYALGPCASEGVRLTVWNQLDKEKAGKSMQICTPEKPTRRSSVTALWGPKALENIIDLNIEFEFKHERSALKRLQLCPDASITVTVSGLVSKFAVGCGRGGTDRQFFFINGRPCNMSKAQKAFNEAYRSFNATQSPFVVADFTIPTDSYDVNVSPDKRTILVHNEENFIAALKDALETHFSPERSTFSVQASQIPHQPSQQPSPSRPVDPTVATSDDASEPTLQGSSTTSSQHEPAKRSRSNAALVEPSSPQRSYHPVEMNVSEDESEDDVVVLDSSQSVWGRRLGLASSSPASGSSNSRRQVASADPMDVDEDEDDTFQQPSSEVAEEPARKRRRSEFGMAIPISPSKKDDRDPRVQGDEEQGVDEMVDVERPSAAAAARPVVSVSTSRCSTLFVGPTRGATSVNTAAKATKPLKKAQIQTRLEGFIRPGSRLPSSSRRSTRREAEQQDEPESEAESGTADEDQTSPGLGSDCVRASPSTNANVNKEDLSDLEDQANGKSSLRPEPSPGTRRQPVGKDGEDEVDESEESKDTPPSATQPLKAPSVVDVVDDSPCLPGEASISSTPLSVPSPHDPATVYVEVERENEGEDVVFRTNLDRMKKIWNLRSRRQLASSTGDMVGVEASGSSTPQANTDSLSDAAGIQNVGDSERASVALARVIDKADFGQMEIIGQFNRGFILVRRRKIATHPGRDAKSSSGMQPFTTGGAVGSAGSGSNRDEQGPVSGEDEVSGGRIVMDDLFIVDQHAADEKYNFETLQATTKIESQKLFRPRPLELTAADEILAFENLDVLRQNGFEIDVDEQASFGQGSRLKLISQPVSKNTVFDMKDLEEVVHLLRDRPAGQMVRCSKARAMFAMRACRKSVMVGTTLSKQQMTTVVRHMGTMDQPWNCPHGRPTMRHLADIRTFEQSHEYAAYRRGLDWSHI